MRVGNLRLPNQLIYFRSWEKDPILLLRQLAKFTEFHKVCNL